MSLHLTFGIDPGQSGAVAVLVDGAFAEFVDMPTMPRPAGGHQIAAAELARTLRDIRQRHAGADVTAVLEAVSAMPGQGVSSMFRFGEGFGVIQGVLGALAIPVVLVHPARWKKSMGLTGREKDVARTVAMQRFPRAAAQLARKKDIGRADALLIAAWARGTEQTGRRDSDVVDAELDTTGATHV